MFHVNYIQSLFTQILNIHEGRKASFYCLVRNEILFNFVIDMFGKKKGEKT